MKEYDICFANSQVRISHDSHPPVSESILTVGAIQLVVSVAGAVTVSNELSTVFIPEHAACDDGAVV